MILQVFAQDSSSWSFFLAAETPIPWALPKKSNWMLGGVCWTAANPQGIRELKYTYEQLHGVLRWKSIELQAMRLSSFALLNMPFRVFQRSTTRRSMRTWRNGPKPCTSQSLYVNLLLVCGTNLTIERAYGKKPTRIIQLLRKRCKPVGKVTHSTQTGVWHELSTRNSITWRRRPGCPSSKFDNHQEQCRIQSSTQQTTWNGLSCAPRFAWWFLQATQEFNRFSATFCDPYDSHARSCRVTDPVNPANSGRTRRR